MAYDNTPTVVVVIVPILGGPLAKPSTRPSTEPLAGLLMVRRALPGEGQGRLALPGGYQMTGQSWREAGAREVLEETGVAVDPAMLRLVAVETTPDRRQNLLFCEAPPTAHDGPFAHDAEVSEVVVIHGPVDTAFPLHTVQVAAFFARY